MAKPWEKYRESQAAPEQKPWEKHAKQEAHPQPESRGNPLSLGNVFRTMTGALPVEEVGNLQAGLLRGAGSIGATWLAPYDMAVDAVDGKGFSLESNRERRAAIDGGLQSLGADPDSGLYKTGKIAGEIAGTAGAGNVLANGARAIGAAPSVVSALSSGGMNVAGKTGLQGLALRGAGGAAVGGASAGLVNPDDAGLGAAIGGAIPVVGKGVLSATRAAGSAVRGSAVSDEVAALAGRAKDLGIDIPADRLTNSKPLNAVAASLEYAPFSGRAATVDRMTSQLNRAVSRTVGQDSDNVTGALRQASDTLGSEFDRVLRSTSVNVDSQLMADMAQRGRAASRVLNKGDARIIQNQIDDIAEMGATGQIDAQAAYNIKRTLDEIAKRNSPEASHAKDLRSSLMDAINRSLGPDEAAAFATTRKQYGNMKKLEILAQNGAEGDISIGRLANLKNIHSPDLQELADISAQFLKTRESPHGALQRLVIGGTGLTAAAGAGSLPIGVGLLAAGRGANSLLNSNAMRSAVLGRAGPNSGLLGSSMRLGLTGATKAAPVIVAQ